MQMFCSKKEQTSSKRIFIKNTIIISEITMNKRIIALKDDKDKIYIWYKKIIKIFQFPSTVQNIEFSYNSEYIYGFAENNIYQLSMSGFKQMLTFQITEKIYSIMLSINSKYQIRYIIQILDNQQLLVLHQRQIIKYDFSQLQQKKIEFNSDIIYFHYLVDNDMLACMSPEQIYISKYDSIIVQQKIIKNKRTNYVNPSYTQIRFLLVNYLIMIINGFIIIYKISYDQKQIYQINSFEVNNDCILRFQFDYQKQYLTFYGFKETYYYSTKNRQGFEESVDLIEFKNEKVRQVIDFKIVDCGKAIQTLIKNIRFNS